MKNNFLIILFLLFITKLSYAETLEINAKYISIDKKEQTTVFKEKVTIQDEVGNLIKSNYANYNKNTNFIILKENISAIDKYGNLFESQNATYNENEKVLKTEGKTKITTSEGYIVNTKSIIHPVLTTNYDRQYFISNNNKVRATVDYNLQSIYLKNFSQMDMIKNFAYKCILEIKYPINIDNYVRKNLKNMTLRLSKNSKFINSAVETPSFVF